MLGNLIILFSASRAEQGLEISAMAVVDVSKKHGYSLSVQQTPSKTLSSESEVQPETTRINHYLAQLEATVPYLPNSRRYQKQLNSKSDGNEYTINNCFNYSHFCQSHERNRHESLHSIRS